MMPTAQTPSDKMKSYRAKLRAAGLRPVQIWVPDVKNSAFVKKLHDQVQNLDLSHENETLEFFEHASDDTGWF